MARKKQNIHYIYKTTCSITGRYYVGMHSTSNENDGYMGSGLHLRRSIRKYGVDNHTKEILSYHDSRELLVEAEKSAITDDMVLDKDCMNLKLGGTGGFSSEEHMTKCQLAGGNASLNKMENDSEYKKIVLTNLTEGRKELYLSGGYKKMGKGAGRVHSDETRQLMSESMKGKGIGEANSQYGTCWMIKDGVCKKVAKDEIENHLHDGWITGRK